MKNWRIIAAIGAVAAVVALGLIAINQKHVAEQLNPAEHETAAESSNDAGSGAENSGAIRESVPAEALAEPAPAATPSDSSLTAPSNAEPQADAPAEQVPSTAGAPTPTAPATSVPAGGDHTPAKP